MLPIPAGVISFRGAGGSPLKILGYIRYVLTLGNKSLPVEALILPHLSPYSILIDNSIIHVFGAKLDWAAERISLRDGNTTMPAIHTRKHIKSKCCSVIIHDSDTAIPVFIPNKYTVSLEHEAPIHVFGAARPQTYTLALVEPKIEHRGHK